MSAIAGAALVLDEPLSLWGGIDPATGEIVDGRHPQRGQRVTGRVAGRVLLVGDAAGYVDALTGEGIGLALAQADAAAGCLAAGRPGRYEPVPVAQADLGRQPPGPGATSKPGAGSPASTGS